MATAYVDCAPFQTSIPRDMEGFGNYYGVDQCFFDTAHAEDFERYHTKYIPPALTSTASSSFCVFTNDIMEKHILPAIARTGLDTVYSFTKAVKDVRRDHFRNKFLASFLPTLRAAHHDRSFSIFEDRRYFSAALADEIIPKMTTSFNLKPYEFKHFLVMLEALGRGHVTLFNWFISCDETMFKIYHSSLALALDVDRIHTTKTRTERRLKPSVANILQRKKELEALEAQRRMLPPKTLAKSVFDADSDNDEEDDGMDTTTTTNHSDSAASMVIDLEDDANYEMIEVEEVVDKMRQYRLHLSNPRLADLNFYNAADNIFNAISGKHAKNLVARLASYKSMLLAYACSPMVGEMADPAQMAEYQERLRVTMSGKPAWEWTEILTAKQCLLLKRRSMKLPNIFNLYDTEWSGVTGNSLHGSYFNRTHEAVDERLITTALAFMQFLMRGRRCFELSHGLVDGKDAHVYTYSYNLGHNGYNKYINMQVPLVDEVVLSSLQAGNLALVRAMVERGLWSCNHASSVDSMIIGFPNNLVVSYLDEPPIYIRDGPKNMTFWRFYNSLLFGMISNRRFLSHTFHVRSRRLPTQPMTYAEFLLSIQCTQTALYSMVESVIYMHPRSDNTFDQLFYVTTKQSDANSSDDSSDEDNNAKNATNIDIVQGSLWSPMILVTTAGQFSQAYEKFIDHEVIDSIDSISHWFIGAEVPTYDFDIKSGRFDTQSQGVKSLTAEIPRHLSAYHFLRIGYASIINELVINEQWDVFVWMLQQWEAINYKDSVAKLYRIRNSIMNSHQILLMECLLWSVLCQATFTRRSVVPLLDWIQNFLHPLVINNTQWVTTMPPQYGMEYDLRDILPQRAAWNFREIVFQHDRNEILAKQPFSIWLGLVMMGTFIVNGRRGPFSVRIGSDEHDLRAFEIILPKYQQRLAKVGYFSPTLYHHLIGNHGLQSVTTILQTAYKLNWAGLITNEEDPLRNLQEFNLDNILLELDNKTFAISEQYRISAVLSALHHDLLLLINGQPLSKNADKLLTPWFTYHMNFKSISPMEAIYQDWVKWILEKGKLGVPAQYEAVDEGLCPLSHSFFARQYPLARFRPTFSPPNYQSEIFDMLASLLAMARLHDANRQRQLPATLLESFGFHNHETASGLVRGLLQRWYPDHLQEMFNLLVVSTADTYLIAKPIAASLSKQPTHLEQPIHIEPLGERYRGQNGMSLLLSEKSMGIFAGLPLLPALRKYLIFQMDHWTQLAKKAMESWIDLLFALGSYLNDDLELSEPGEQNFQVFSTRDPYLTNLWYNQQCVKNIRGWNYLAARLDMFSLGLSPLQQQRLKTPCDFLVAIHQLPNNMVTFFGAREEVIKREAFIDSLTQTWETNHPDHLPEHKTKLKTILGRVMVHCHLLAQRSVTSFSAYTYPYGIQLDNARQMTHLVPIRPIFDISVNTPSLASCSNLSFLQWLIATDAMDMMEWFHTTFLAPKVTSLDDFRQYVTDVTASSKNLSDVERLNRVELYRRPMETGDDKVKAPFKLDFHNLLGFAILSNSPKAFDFVRANYMVSVRRQYWQNLANLPATNTIFEWRGITRDIDFGCCPKYSVLPTSSLWTEYWYNMIGEKRQSKNIKSLNIHSEFGPLPLLNLPEIKDKTTKQKVFRKYKKKLNPTGETPSYSSNNSANTSVDTSSTPHRKRSFDEAFSAVDLSHRVNLDDDDEEEVEEQQQEPPVQVRSKRPRHYNPAPSEEDSSDEMDVDDDEDNGITPILNNTNNGDLSYSSDQNSQQEQEQEADEGVHRYADFWHQEGNQW